jgi:GDYXXLXY protein
MSRRFTALAVVLPLLAVLLGVVRAELFRGRARDFVFEIAGYDPRDLLRGHYLQFRLRIDPLPVREPCDDEAADCCLCLTRSDPDAVPYAERATCATARVSCDGALLIRYLNEPQRYYVPEQSAALLEKRLLSAMEHRRAHAVLAIDASGQAQVRELRVDGEPISGRAEHPSP